MSLTTSEDHPEPRRTERLKEQRDSRFTTNMEPIRIAWRSGTKQHIAAYDMMYDFLDSNRLVMVNETNPHRQRLHGDLLEWLETRGIKDTAAQAKQPFTAFIKYACYDEGANIDNPGEKSKIAVASMVLQASFYWGRKPSDCVKFDGGGTEGGLARAYREERKRQGQGRTRAKPKTPDQIITAACEDTIGNAKLDAASRVKVQSGSNVLRLPDGEPVLLLATRHGDDLHLHGWIDPRENIRAVKQILSSLE